MQELRLTPVIKCICLNVEMYLPKFQNVFVYKQAILVGANCVHVEEDARYVAQAFCAVTFALLQNNTLMRYHNVLLQ